MIRHDLHGTQIKSANTTHSNYRIDARPKTLYKVLHVDIRCRFRFQAALFSECTSRAKNTKQPEEYDTAFCMSGGTV